MITRSLAISIFFAWPCFPDAPRRMPPRTPMASPELARPDQIWVYDFIADPARLPADSSIGPGVSAPSKPLTAEELASGAWRPHCKRRGCGYPPWVFPQCKPVRERRRELATAYFAVTWFRLRRQRGKRFVIGFGAGSSEMDTVVEGYEMTPRA